jgi:hypothetical protein
MWFRLLERNILRPQKNEVVLLKLDLSRVSLSLFLFFDPWKWRLPEPFTAQGRAVTTSPKARQVASGQIKPYAVGHHQAGVANDVFKGVGTPGLVVCLTAHRQQCGAVPLHRWEL